MRWYTDAAEVDRLARVGPVRAEEPDLTEQVLAAVRLPHRRRWPTLARVTLIVVAIAQVGIGLANLIEPLGMRLVMHVSPHMDHEEAAFNLAFAAALLFIGISPRRAATQLPVLASFVAVLTVASVFDLAEGHVTWSRLATHAPIVAGLLLVTALSRHPHPGAHRARTATNTDQTAAGAGAASQPLPDLAARPSEHRTPPPAAHRHIA